MADTDIADTDDIGGVFDQAMDEIEDKDRVDYDLGGDDGGGGDLSDDQEPDHRRQAKRDTDRGKRGESDAGADRAGTGAAIAVDRAREAQTRLAELENGRDQWRKEHSDRDAALKAAQAKRKEIRTKVRDGEATDEEEDAAVDAVADARFQLHQAKSALDQWERAHQELANAPKLAPAQQAWLDAHPEYDKDSAFRDRAQQAMREALADGLDPTHMKFYERVNESMREPARMGSNSRRAPAAPAVHTSGRSRAAAESDHISPKEERFIRKIGKNPKSKKVRAQWVKSRASTRRIVRERRGL